MHKSLHKLHYSYEYTSKDKKMFNLQNKKNYIIFILYNLRINYNSGTLRTGIIQILLIIKNKI